MWCVHTGKSDRIQVKLTVITCKKKKKKNPVGICVRLNNAILQREELLRNLT